MEFNEFFGSSFRRSLLCFLVFRCSIFKVPFATALCDSLFSISHSVPFVKGFLNFFQVSFRHFRPPQVTLPRSSSLSSCLSAPSGTGSLAELYYITTFLSFCQPLFSSFFTFFPFLFDVSPFFTPFYSLFRSCIGFKAAFSLLFLSVVRFSKKDGFWFLFRLFEIVTIKSRCADASKVVGCEFCASETAGTGRIVSRREQDDHVSRRLWARRQFSAMIFGSCVFVRCQVI